jgi:hypothetical protein
MKGRKIIDCLRDEYNAGLRKEVLGNVKEGGRLTKDARNSPYSPLTVQKRKNSYFVKHNDNI